MDLRQHCAVQSFYHVAFEIRYMFLRASCSRWFVTFGVDLAFGRELDLALGIAEAGDGDLRVAIADEAWEFLSPLDEEDIAGFEHGVFQAEGSEFTIGFDAIEVDVKQSAIRPVVFMH